MDQAAILEQLSGPAQALYMPSDGPWRVTRSEAFAHTARMHCGEFSDHQGCKYASTPGKLMFVRESAAPAEDNHHDADHDACMHGVRLTQ